MITDLKVYRMFDGRKYQLHAYGPSKSRSQKFADAERMLGYNVRIIETKGVPMFGPMKVMKLYAVYVSVKKREK